MLQLLQMLTSSSPFPSALKVLPWPTSPPARTASRTTRSCPSRWPSTSCVSALPKRYISSQTQQNKHKTKVKNKSTVDSACNLDLAPPTPTRVEEAPTECGGGGGAVKWRLHCPRSLPITLHVAVGCLQVPPYAVVTVARPCEVTACGRYAP